MITDNKLRIEYYHFLNNTLILLLLYLIMEPKKGDEHLHHPVCEVCQKEFGDVHELSKHVNEEHRNQDRAA
jgi:hypothetical protein